MKGAFAPLTVGVERIWRVFRATDVERMLERCSIQVPRSGVKCPSVRVIGRRATSKGAVRVGSRDQKPLPNLLACLGSR